MEPDGLHQAAPASVAALWLRNVVVSPSKHRVVRYAAWNMAA